MVGSTRDRNEKQCLLYKEKYDGCHSRGPEKVFCKFRGGEAHFLLSILGKPQCRRKI